MLDKPAGPSNSLGLLWRIRKALELVTKGRSGWSLYRRTFQNPACVMALAFLGRYPFDVILLTGEAVHVTRYAQVLTILGLVNPKVSNQGRLVEFEYLGRRLVFNTPGEAGCLSETFGEEQYRDIEVRGRVCVDVGANIGDSAIYFALRGAKHVYAVEPYPALFELARANVIANGVAQRVTLINAGVAGRTGSIKVDPTRLADVGSDLRAAPEGVSVPTLSFADLVSRFDLPPDSLLKMDCEGCEYETFNVAPLESLRRFSEIVIEYHYGATRLVRSLVTAGFTPRATRAISEFDAHSAHPHMRVGRITAIRSGKTD